MFFTIPNNKYQSMEQLRTSVLIDAYFLIDSYPMRGADLVLEQYLQQHYNDSLKNICVKLLLSLTFYEDKDGNLILLFKNPKHDEIASLITYGNGAIPGSRILQIALKK